MAERGSNEDGVAVDMDMHDEVDIDAYLGSDHHQEDIFVKDVDICDHEEVSNKVDDDYLVDHHNRVNCNDVDDHSLDNNLLLFHHVHDHVVAPDALLKQS